jgi:hypothetical protein
MVYLSYNTQSFVSKPLSLPSWSRGTLCGACCDRALPSLGTVVSWIVISLRSSFVLRPLLDGPGKFCCHHDIALSWLHDSLLTRVAVSRGSMVHFRHVRRHFTSLVFLHARTWTVTTLGNADGIYVPVEHLHVHCILRAQFAEATIGGCAFVVLSPIRAVLGIMPRALVGTFTEDTWKEALG